MLALVLISSFMVFVHTMVSMNSAMLDMQVQHRANAVMMQMEVFTDAIAKYCDVNLCDTTKVLLVSELEDYVPSASRSTVVFGDNASPISVAVIADGGAVYGVAKYNKANLDVEPKFAAKIRTGLKRDDHPLRQSGVIKAAAGGKVNIGDFTITSTAELPTGKITLAKLID